MVNTILNDSIYHHEKGADKNQPPFNLFNFFNIKSYLYNNKQKILDMSKKQIKITENELHQIIYDSVNIILRKKLNEQSTNQKNVNFLYHATPICYLDSIKKYGLGGKMPKIRFWNYKNTPYDNISHGCFLSTDEYVAESYVESSDYFDELAEIYENKYGKELDIIVFKINVNDLNQNLLSIDSNQYHDGETDLTYFYNGIIPYEKLQQIKLY